MPGQGVREHTAHQKRGVHAARKHGQILRCALRVIPVPLIRRLLFLHLRQAEHRHRPRAGLGAAAAGQFLRPVFPVQGRTGGRQTEGGNETLLLRKCGNAQADTGQRSQC